ncbi:MAG: protein kinase [Acidobacteriota bacterium]|nr:protein kinase [Acidobacteriota bacterium]
MGEVYLALDTELGRFVALKVLPADVASDDQRMRRFTLEAKSAAALNHPNIAHIYEIGRSDETHFIAMEYVEGVTLREHIKDARLQLSDVLDICIQVASALAEAHAAGIIHRDIKPENIMVRPNGYVKVLDFGLAKLMQQPPTTTDQEAPTKTLVMTEPGGVMGTVLYMSPEQTRGLQVDARTDIWSLGVVLYEMVARRLPFEGATATDVTAAILGKEPPPMARYAREVPETLEWIVTKALRKDRDERYQTAKDLMTDLRTLKKRIEFAAELERSASPESNTEPPVPSLGGGSLTETVKQLAVSTTEAKSAIPTLSAEYIVGEIKRHKTGLSIAVASLVLALIGMAAVGVYKLLMHAPVETTKKVAPLRGMKLARLTSTGTADQAAISPDGKYMVHVASENGQQSLRVRQVNTLSDVQIVPPTDVQYAGLTFSRDGDFIYYVAAERDSPTSNLYQVAALGGAPRKLIADVGSAITFSPDGQRLAFIRDFPNLGEKAVIVAGASGGGEHKLAVRKLPNFFRSVSWSPDGKSIACGAGSFVPTYNTYVVEVSVENGKEKQIGSQSWYFMGQVAWLADGSGLVLEASEQGSASSDVQQIWYLSYPDGEAHRITNDLNNYKGMSLTMDSNRLVTVQSETVSNIWLIPNGETGRAMQITVGPEKRDGQNGLAWTPDGKIVYTSKVSGSDDIWIMNGDGSGQKQLTTNSRINVHPSVSFDGRYIIFTSDQAGTSNIWRMDMDGGNQKQLTSGSGEDHAQSSPDGKWVIYTLLGAGQPTLWRVSMQGGAPQQLTDKYSIWPSVSPDGQSIACLYRDDQPNSPLKIAIFPFEGGQPRQIFDAPVSAGAVYRLTPTRWTPDGRALTYVVTTGGVSNLWSQPSAGGASKQLTNFKSDRIFWFDLSRDGRQLLAARGTRTSDVVLISNFK